MLAFLTGSGRVGSVVCVFFWKFFGKFREEGRVLRFERERVRSGCFRVISGRKRVIFFRRVG